MLLVGYLRWVRSHGPTRQAVAIVVPVVPDPKVRPEGGLEQPETASAAHEPSDHVTET